MKNLIKNVLVLIILFSCSPNEETRTSNKYDDSEWTPENKETFLKKCSNSMDQDLCKCILDKFISTGKNVIEVGEMNHNEYMSLAKECKER